jgi:hypothetical protein
MKSKLGRHAQWLGVAMTVVAAAVALSAPAAAGGGSGPSFVVGAGERGTPTGQVVNQFAVAAFGGANGALGLYHVRAAAPDAGEFDVAVKCIYAIGNLAVIGGVIVHEVNRPPVGTGFAIAFEDSGHPQGGVIPDRVSVNDFFTEPGRTPPTTQADCIAESFLFTLMQPMVSGDIAVHSSA